VLHLLYGYYGYSCHYDATSDVLVGASSGNDLGQGCTAGDLSDGTCNAPEMIFERNCPRAEPPDGGVEVS
jgi:hypothetical protein